MTEEPEDPGIDARLGMAAWSLAAIEGKSGREIAAQLGVSVSKLPALVRSGAKSYNQDPAKALALLTPPETGRRGDS